LHHGSQNDHILDPHPARRRDVAGRHLGRERGASGQDSHHDQGTDAHRRQGHVALHLDKDSDGKSACNGPCAANWPALKADAGDSAGDNYTVIARDDGSKQWAYKGKPLYTFAKDQKAGDISGDGFLNGAWHLAQP
jgi:predicted lipoprotein with Yx(FWY)xxD motif